MPDVPQEEIALEGKIEDSSVREAFTSWKGALRSRNFVLAEEGQKLFMDSLAGWLKREDADARLYELLEDVVAEEILKDLRAKDPSRTSINDFAPLLMYFAELPACAQLVFEKRTNKEAIPANELDFAFRSDVEDMIDGWEAVIKGRVITRSSGRISPPRIEESQETLPGDMKFMELPLTILYNATREELDTDIWVGLAQIHEAIRAVLQEDEYVDELTTSRSLAIATADKLKDKHKEQIAVFLAGKGQKYNPESWVLSEGELTNMITFLADDYWRGRRSG